MDEENAPKSPLLRTIVFWQFIVVGATIAGTTLLARYKVWPFGTTPLDPGDEPSIWEVMLLDRLMIGFLRIGVVAVSLYVIVSVPALVISRRWMKGLSTAGLTADDARTADTTIEELQDELRATQEELQDQVTRTDFAQQLLLELQSGQQVGDNPPEDGER
ncbi:MAG: hypothetical protein ACRDJV_12670 [Actinomycetota bacterium]